MKQLFALVFVILFSAFAFTQNPSREQKIQTIFDLRTQLVVLEKEILQPSASDMAIADKSGVSAVRILPGEKYDGVLTIYGGGAFYSFLEKSHNAPNDLHFEKGDFGVGYAGADYGFLRDLGEVGLSEISRETPDLEALLTYVPPVEEASVRAMQVNLWKGYEVNGFSYISRVPATVGHSYLLRSVAISRSDVLVAFHVVRKDTDGSLIIFWKPIETFAKPLMRHQGEAVAR